MPESSWLNTGIQISGAYKLASGMADKGRYRKWMQNGFVHRGTIHVDEDDNPRMAFEKMDQSAN